MTFYFRLHISIKLKKEIELQNPLLWGLDASIKSCNFESIQFPKSFIYEAIFHVYMPFDALTLKWRKQCPTNTR